MIDQSDRQYAQQALRQAAQRREKALQHARRRELKRKRVPSADRRGSAAIFVDVSPGYVQDIPVLIRMAQNGADLKKNTGSNAKGYQSQPVHIDR